MKNFSVTRTLVENSDDMAHSESASEVAEKVTRIEFESSTLKVNKEVEITEEDEAKPEIDDQRDEVW